jgi:Fur family transcriptional regulator, ferric uptake regulator
MAIVRFTKQRQAVLEVVKASSEHPDAAHVFDEVRRIVPSISLGTVYRSLDALVQEGHLIQVQQPGMATRYDARLEDHAHFICATCGEVSDVMTELPDLVGIVASSLPGFELREAKVAFHGICERCKRSN